MNRDVLFSPPDISNVEIEKVIEVLKSGWITTGPKTKLLEHKLSEYCHTPKAVCLNSATAAAEMTLHLLGIGPGDEVITCAYTYTASASIVYHVGAKLVLVDVEPDTFHINYDQLEAAISDKTKVIIPVDMAGVPCDYDRLFDIVNRKKDVFQANSSLQKAMGRIAVLADCAHGLGSSYHGNPAGSLADFTTFSFHAVKNLTTAEGGAVTWRSIEGIDNEDIYHDYMLLSLHGQSKDALAKTTLGAWEYDIVMPAYKCNMTDIMAALGLGQLERYAGILERRKELVALYNRCLEGENVQILAHSGENFDSSRHLYLVRLLDMGVEQRNALIKGLAERGITTNVHYKPLPMHTAYQKFGFDIADYPLSYAMYHNEITLPLHTKLSNEDVQYVADNFKELLHSLR